MLRGTPPQMYFECYQGSENLNQPLPTSAITGTISFSPITTTILGSGTSFFDELHIGQMLLAETEVIVVKQITDDTHFTACRLPLSTENNVAALRCPIIFTLNFDIGSLLRGNAVEFDKGTILAVGDGELLVNGSALPGDSLTATRRAQVALYDASTQTYDVQPIGFDDVPTFPTITVVGSGGTKNMSLGYYSFRVAYGSSVTTGYGNPTDTILSGGTIGYQLTLASSVFEFDFSADSPPTKADSYVIYASAFQNSSAQSQINAIQGAWFEIRRVKFSELTANKIRVEYTDSELGDAVSIDNDSPADAEFIATLTNYPILISTNGRGVGSGARQAETSPGAFISPIKTGNFDGYPSDLKVPTEKGEIILGVKGVAGRLFLMCPNTLQATSATQLPTAPFTTRPFWMRGFTTCNNLAVIDDKLYGFTSGSMFRSIAEGDTGNESNDFASDVKSLLSTYNAGYEFTEHDPKNEYVCVIISAKELNSDGWWTSEILPFSLDQQVWVDPIVLSRPDRDMIVSGTASVNGFLYFVAGGRKADTSIVFDTWRFDTGNVVEGDEEIDWSLTWTLADNGLENFAKVIRKLRVTGKFTNAVLRIYATKAGEEINIADIDAGTNPLYEISLADSTAVTRYNIIKTQIKNLQMWTVQIAGTWDGIGNKDRFDECFVEIFAMGAMR